MMMSLRTQNEMMCNGMTGIGSTVGHRWHETLEGMQEKKSGWERRACSLNACIVFEEKECYGLGKNHKQSREE
jgi:hypothetical protein